MTGLRLAAALAAAALAGACASPDVGPTAVVRTEDGAVLRVEVADSPEERRRGLMGRTSLPEDAGMLFVHDDDVRTGFWMKDTLIPLSIAFLDRAGRVLEILDMEPCRADPCPRYRPGVPYRSALEVNLGAFARLGVRAGDVLAIER